MDYILIRAENGWILHEDNRVSGHWPKSWICPTPESVGDVIREIYRGDDKAKGL